MDIEKLISALPQYKKLKLKTLRDNATRLLESDPENIDARRLLYSIDKYDQTRTKMAPTIDGPIEWEIHGHANASLGWVDGNVVAKISKLKNHKPTTNDDNIYSIEVDGTQLPDHFRCVKAARRAGNKEYFRIIHPNLAD